MQKEGLLCRLLGPMLRQDLCQLLGAVILSDSEEEFLKRLEVHYINASPGSVMLELQTFPGAVLARSRISTLKVTPIKL